MKEFVKICAKYLPIMEPIYEFGSFQVLGQENFANLRPFFNGMEYIGADLRMGTGVDVILDMQNIDLPSEIAGCVLSLDTFEHVEYPRKAIDECYRILKPNGIFIMSSVMNSRIHGCPHDYWRFTPEAFMSLLKPFEQKYVGYIGEDSFPSGIVGIGFKGLISPEVMKNFTDQYSVWKKKWDKKHGFSHLIKFCPPVVLPFFVKLYQALRGVKEDFSCKLNQ